MQIILESLTQEHLRQLSVCSAIALTLTADDGARMLEQTMGECGYNDNEVVKVRSVRIGITEKYVQLIVKYLYTDDDNDDDGEEEGTFYITSPEPFKLSGDF